MSTQNERSAKAQIIWNSTDSNSITPTMVGSLFYDINIEKLERDNSNAVYQTYDSSYTKVAAINPATKKMTLIDIPSGNPFDYVQLDTTALNTYEVGKFYWNETKGTYDFGLKNNVTLQLGQEQYVYGKAYSAISNGQLVMYRTSQGGHILFEPANFTQLSTNPDLIIGVATQDIALNDFGYITTFGEVNTLNTSSFADGGTLYFGSGNVLQNTTPNGSYFIVGRVNRSHATQGSIFVKPYFVDGNLESKSNKSDSYTASSSTTYASTKALVDGLATKADLIGGKVPSSQLPAYVDDVLEFANLASFPATGESGKIYVALNTNLTYRWSGTTYAEISPSLALGETSSTAYRGDRGKTAYDHSQTIGNPHGTTKGDIGLGNVDNTSDANKPISTATQTALNGKENIISVGNTSQYFRGDKTWQTLNSSAVGLGNVLNVDATNPANITQSASYRFVTDTEKATWNAKQNALTNPITGTGTSGFHAKFNGTSTLTNSIIYDDGTNVGVSNTDPRAKLSVGSNNGGSKIMPTNTKVWIQGSGGASSTDLQSRISFGFNDNPDYGFYFGNINVDYGATPMIGVLGTRDASSDKPTLYIKDSKVGVATMNPTEKLEVNGNIKATSFIKSGGTSTQFLMADGSVSTLTNPVTGTGTTNYLPKFLSSGTVGNSLIFDNGTNVGVGTTLPVNQLHVSSTTDGPKQLLHTLSNTNGAYTGLLFKVSAITSDLSKKGGIFFERTGQGGVGNIHFAINNIADTSNVTLSQTKMTIVPSGNIGIGTTTPSTLLDVNHYATFLANTGNRLKIWDGTDNIPTITADNLLEIDSPSIRFDATDVIDSHYTSIYLKLKTVNGNVTIDNSYHNKIVRITASCTITIPNNLRTDFNCTFEVIGAYTAQFVDGSGATTSAPFGRYLKTDLTAMFYCTGTASNYRLNGSLTTS